eukprot:CAMPEP_0198508728 /NCGR_PEP_ID=MMETSP1462-20131121/13140_1 /TAXON_ID=1333877 /ORGANISM="Brandtodinium nutriculum, Strain RCC3387" /LENGTH=83 /DNA_ID=CAMNT_0044238015 /DNA_START=316 /DNA_END=564 /DNA_ORIENTATION=+
MAGPLGAGRDDRLARVVRQVRLVHAPDPCVNAASAVRHHERVACLRQCEGEGRLPGVADEAADVQILRVRKHAAIRVACSAGP